MAISKVEQGKIIDIKVLNVINNFRFIRAIELGKMLWPESRYSEKNASNQLKKLVKKRLIIERKLPDCAGFCYVLSLKGMKLLKDSEKSDIEPENGARWGNTEISEWQPPKTWRHDLIAAGILAECKKQGYEIFSDRQIRSEYTKDPSEKNRVEKYPDGMFADPNGTGLGFFIEVERARKSGEKMRNLIQHLVHRNRGRYFSYPVKETYIAFTYDQEDEREYRISHETRIRNAIQREIGENDRFFFTILSVQMKGAGVGSVATIDRRVFGSREVREKSEALKEALFFYKNIDWVIDTNGNHRSHFKALDLKIEQENEVFFWSVRKHYEGKGYKTFSSGENKELEEAKKECVKSGIEVAKSVAKEEATEK